MSMADLDSSAADDADIVREILRQVAAAAPQCGPEEMRRIELEVRSRFGGRRWFVAKAKPVSPERHRAIVQDGLTNMSTAEIVSKHGISRATLYRLMKKPPST